MHRGSSKGPQAFPAAPERLPLSAPVSVELELVQGGGVTHVRLSLASSSTIRDMLRSAGLAPEGCAVLFEGRSQPLDLPVHDGARFTVIRTFSGG